MNNLGKLDIKNDISLNFYEAVGVKWVFSSGEVVGGGGGANYFPMIFKGEERAPEINKICLNLY